MQQGERTITLCLKHQLPEDRASRVGLVCTRCKHRLDTRPPEGRCRSFWESQPVAYGLEGKPCFVYTLWWDDYRIRSLHPPESHVDARVEKVRAANAQQAARDAAAEESPSEYTWLDDIRLERGLIDGVDFDLDE